MIESVPGTVPYVMAGSLLAIAMRREVPRANGSDRAYTRKLCPQCWRMRQSTSPSGIDAPCTNVNDHAPVCIVVNILSSAAKPTKNWRPTVFQKICDLAMSPLHARPLTQSYLIRSKNKLAAAAARQEGGAGVLLRGQYFGFGTLVQGRHFRSARRKPLSRQQVRRGLSALADVRGQAVRLILSMRTLRHDALARKEKS